MGLHSIFFPDLAPVPGGVITVSGEEAHHALRVKRLGVGDVVRLCNGRGVVAEARLVDSRKTRDGWAMDLDVMSAGLVPVARPRLNVLAAAPKGERLAAMIDGLSQVGAASWSPLVSERTVVEPREGKLERLERVALESMKQCGRAWVLDIGTAVEFGAVAGAGVVMADASGERYAPLGGDEVSLMIGPEGGWSERELRAGREAGFRVVSFGRHVMRTEVAAVVGAALVLEAEGAG